MSPVIVWFYVVQEIVDFGFWIADFGLRIADCGYLCRMFNVGPARLREFLIFSVIAAVRRVSDLVPGSWFLGFGSWVLVLKIWFLGLGSWILVRRLADGTWDFSGSLAQF
jgi:hypothetical protein